MKFRLLLFFCFLVSRAVHAAEVLMVQTTDGQPIAELSAEDKKEVVEASRQLFELNGRVGPLLELEGQIRVASFGNNGIYVGAGVASALAVYADGAFPTGPYGQITYEHELKGGRVVRVSVVKGKFLNSVEVANNVADTKGRYSAIRISSLNEKGSGAGLGLLFDPDKSGAGIVPLLFFEKKLN